MPPEDQPNVEAGLRNLFIACAGLKAGQSVLLVGESGENPYFEPTLVKVASRVAQQLGLSVDTIFAEPVSGAGDFPPVVAHAMQAVDVTIFFSRLGDQVRFSDAPGSSTKVMCYATTPEYFAAPFATVSHHSMRHVHDLLVNRLLSAKTYRISAPCGTELYGEIDKEGKSWDGATTEFHVEQFPIMIFPPINTHRLGGTLIVDRFITSSSTRAYDDSTLRIETPVVATLEDSRVVGLEGEPALVEAMNTQLERAAELTSGNPCSINSWHTGINPGTFFHQDPYKDLEYWGTVTFGSPRYTHFHGAGYDPGDIAYHLMDATIAFDDEVYWENGRFVFLERPEVRDALPPEDCAYLNAGANQDICI